MVAWRSWLTRDVYTVKIAGSNPAVTFFIMRSGAAEACWAHNPEVPRSKLGFANFNFPMTGQMPLFVLSLDRVLISCFFYTLPG